MSIVGLAVAGILALLLIVFAARPFFALPENLVSFQEKQRERALAYYERVLSNIRDLDDDQATGKISQEEYQSEREVWMNRGVRLLGAGGGGAQRGMCLEERRLIPIGSYFSMLNGVDTRGRLKV